MADPRPAPKAAGAAAETAAAEATWSQTRAILRVIVVILAVAGVLWLVYTLEGVILLVVLAMFFAYLIAPLVELLRRPLNAGGRDHLIPRGLAIGLVYLLLFGTMAVTISLLLPGLGSQITQFGRQAPEYASHLRDRLQGWRYFINPDHFPTAVREAVDKAFAGTMDTAGNYMTSAIAGLLGLLAYLPWLILIPILAFFLLKDADGFRRSALLLLPRGQLRGRGTDFFQEVNRTLAAYIRAQLTACLLIGGICMLGFVILGVPYALVLGLVAGLLEFIPLVGPLVVALSATLVASFHSPGQALMVLLFLGVLRIVHDYVVYPRLIGHGIHLHPLAIILAILCGAELAGIAGIFLAIPVVAVLSVTYRHWLDYRGSDGLVADLLKPAADAALIMSPADAAQAAPRILPARGQSPETARESVDSPPSARN